MNYQASSRYRQCFSDADAKEDENNHVEEPDVLASIRSDDKF